MAWWTRPLIRLLVALAIPLAIPALITAILWTLPGDPAEIICPREICDGTDALAERWNLHRGPVWFYVHWLTSALGGDFDSSWRVQQGVPVAELLWESLPTTATLVLLALGVLLLGAVLAALGWLPRALDPLWQAVGLAPAVILALYCAARIEISHGALSHSGWPATLRLLMGAGVLGLADGALAAAITGTRATFEAEARLRYVQMARLRGESVLVNTLPNVLPALVGQLRARVLHILSGTVVVEVVMGIPGLGEMLFDGTLSQDFGLVLAAAWAFSLMSAALLLLQALVEVSVALWVRRSPAGISGVLQGEPGPAVPGPGEAV
ncbi:MAG TPA: ABC transporter permease subunit [Deltaproteobacteria bacterium]|nr:ABC transporter permease subunit [Deltaproteobacteria bacterium]